MPSASDCCVFAPCAARTYILSAEWIHSACTDMLERAYCLALSTFLGAFCFRKDFSVSAPCAARARTHGYVLRPAHMHPVLLATWWCVPCASVCCAHGQHTWISFCLHRHVGALKLLWRDFPSSLLFRRLFVNCRGTRSYSIGNDHTSPNSPRRHRPWAYQITNPKQ